MIQAACRDPYCPYGLHPFCPACQRYSCPHAAAFIHANWAHLTAAIAALPTAPPWPALEVITALLCERTTARIEWQDAVWHRRVPFLAVDLGVVGQVPAWRLTLGVN